MSKVRSSAEEIQNQIASLMAEADQLKAKADAEGLSPDEQTRLDEIVAQVEQLQKDLEAAQTSQRYEAAKARMAQPTRPAPKLPSVHKPAEPKQTSALGLFLRARLGETMTSEDHYRAGQAGVSLNSDRLFVPVRYDGLNLKSRTVLSKGGAGSGAEYVFQTYSDKVTEYLTYFSPLLGILDSETTPDGNNRTYGIVDDTAMEASYFDSETSPTIAETNLSSANKVLCTKDIHTGFQKATFQELRDSFVSIEDKVAKANANSLARKLENEVINASGNGSTGVQGLLAVDNSVGSVSESAVSMDDLESVYYSVPQQYRANATWLVSDDTARILRRELKDEVGRSLFDRNVIDSVEWDVMLGKRFLTSAKMPDSLILFFVPDFYKLRMVAGQTFQVFTERFAPHTGWLGYMSFGGGWLGPTGASGAIHSLTLTS